MNACIISYFMPNLDKKTVQLQKEVVEKYNKSKHPHYSFQGEIPHGMFIDYFWGLNGVTVDSVKGANLAKQFDYDIVLILDIDCIPLSDKAIDYMIDNAAQGKIIGNAQRSGHIENNQHVFCAPSATAIRKDVFEKIGRPSALETNRGDVLEEYSYQAEAAQIELDFLMPLGYDISPKRMDWETNREPFWRLADGMPNYGIGTTYGLEGDAMFYHNFQIFHPGNQERFWNKCNEVLNG